MIRLGISSFSPIIYKAMAVCVCFFFFFLVSSDELHFKGLCLSFVFGFTSSFVRQLTLFPHLEDIYKYACADKSNIRTCSCIWH